MVTKKDIAFEHFMGATNNPPKRLPIVGVVSNQYPKLDAYILRDGKYNYYSSSTRFKTGKDFRAFMAENYPEFIFKISRANEIKNNPSPINADKIEFEVKVYKAIKAVRAKSVNKQTAQAKLSYAQGMITAGHMLKVFTAAESQLFIEQLKS